MASFKLTHALNTQTASDIAADIAQGVKNGELPPAHIAVTVKKLEKLAKELNSDEEYKEIVLAEMHKFKSGGKNGFEVMGGKCSIGAVHTFYDFSKCQDPLWDSLNAISEEIKKLKKGREDFLKTLVAADSTAQFGLSNNNAVVITGVPSLVWEESGEVAELHAPIKHQKEGVKISV